MLVALLALFVALGGPAQAAKLINGVEDQGRHRRVEAAQGPLASSCATSRATRGPARPSSAPDRSITTRALAPGSVLTGTVGDNSLTAADLAANSVGSDEVADNAIGQSEIRNNGVAASEIADNSIDGGEIVDGGLSIRDIARQVGTLQWPVGLAAARPVRDQMGPGHRDRHRGRLRRGLADLGVAARPRLLGERHQLGDRVQDRRRATAGRADIAPATYTFNYAVLGF